MRSRRPLPWKLLSYSLQGFERANHRSTSKASYKDPNMKMQLTPYHPNAQRNRLPVKFDNEATPFRRFCQVRNASVEYASAPKCLSSTHIAIATQQCA